MKGTYQYLEPFEIDRIHRETMDLMSGPGLPFPRCRARELLAAWGAVEKGECLVFPRERMNQGLHTIRYRGSKKPVKSYANQGGVSLVQEPGKGSFRGVAKEDVERLIRVVNQLTGISYLFLPLPEDPKEEPAIRQMALEQSQKPVIIPLSRKEDACICLEQIGEHSSVSNTRAALMQGEVLDFSPETEDTLMVLSKGRLPAVVSCYVPVQSEAMGMDQLILLGNIQNLVHFFAVQAANAQCPVIYSGYRKRTGSPLGFYPGEDFRFSFLHAAQGQMGDFYKVDSFAWGNDMRNYHVNGFHGFCKNTIYYSLLEMNRGTVISWPGQGDHPDSYSLEYLLLDHEVLFHARAYGKEYPARGESLAVKIIDQVGPSSHYYFYQDDVYQKVQDSLWYGDARENYLFAKKTCLEAAQERLHVLLEGRD